MSFGDDFFELGGDSLIVMQVASRVADMGLELLPYQILECQTVAALAAVVQETATKPDKLQTHRL